MSASLFLPVISLAVLCLTVIAVCYKTGHFFKSMALSALSGIGALFAVNLLSYYTGVTIAVNYITLIISGIFGLSGVIALLFIP